MLVVVGLVLVIACANIANLLLARSAGRGHEVEPAARAWRLRPRLARQYITEVWQSPRRRPGRRCGTGPWRSWTSRLLVQQLSSDACPLARA